MGRGGYTGIQLGWVTGSMQLDLISELSKSSKNAETPAAHGVSAGGRARIRTWDLLYVKQAL